MSTAKFKSAAKRIKALVGFVSEPNSKLFSAFAFCQNRRVPLLAELAENSEHSFLAVSTAGSGFAAACRDCPAKCPCSKKAACSRHSVLKSKSKERLCAETIGAEKGFCRPSIKPLQFLPFSLLTSPSTAAAKTHRSCISIQPLRQNLKAAASPFAMPNHPQNEFFRERVLQIHPCILFEHVVRSSVLTHEHRRRFVGAQAVPAKIPTITIIPYFFLCTTFFFPMSKRAAPLFAAPPSCSYIKFS